MKTAALSLFCASLAAWLAACSAEQSMPPDTFVPDAFVEESCPTTTWRDAYIVWVDAQCAITARCFPKEFVETYCDHASCIVEAMRYHCTSGAEAWCASQYPVDRCDALAQCHADMAVLPCTANDAPSSCYTALK